MPLDERGWEVPDPNPMTRKVNLSRVSTLDEMRRLYGLLQREAATAGFETPEEADDFDVGDDVDPSSPYEHPLDNLDVSHLVQPAAAVAPGAAAPGVPADPAGGPSPGGVPPKPPPAPTSSP